MAIHVDRIRVEGRRVRSGLRQTLIVNKGPLGIPAGAPPHDRRINLIWTGASGKSPALPSYCAVLLAFAGTLVGNYLLNKTTVRQFSLPFQSWYC
jgi:hypothetical protein